MVVEYEDGGYRLYLPDQLQQCNIAPPPSNEKSLCMLLPVRVAEVVEYEDGGYQQDKGGLYLLQHYDTQPPFPSYANPLCML